MAGTVVYAVFDPPQCLTVSVLFSPAEDTSLSQKKKVTVEDLFSEDFKIHDPEAKWISGMSVVLREPGRSLPPHFLSVISMWEFVLSSLVAVKLCRRSDL